MEKAVKAVIEKVSDRNDAIGAQNSIVNDLAVNDKIKSNGPPANRHN